MTHYTEWKYSDKVKKKAADLRWGTSFAKKEVLKLLRFSGYRKIQIWKVYQSLHMEKKMNFEKKLIPLSYLLQDGLGKFFHNPTSWGKRWHQVRGVGWSIWVIRVCSLYFYVHKKMFSLRQGEWSIPSVPSSQNKYQVLGKIQRLKPRGKYVSVA